MGYRISWDNDAKTVLLQEYIDLVRKDDLYQVVRISATYLSAYTHTIHLIIDERRINFALTSVELNYMEKFVPANQGAVVVVTQPGLISYKQVTHELSPQTLTRQGICFVESLRAARQVLQENYQAYTATSSF